MKREDLKDLGIEGELLDKVFALHGQTLNAEKQKHTDELSALQTKLDEANEAITKASESTKSLETVQAELEDYKTKYEEVSGTLASERKTRQIEEALTAAGGQDTEYLMFKLGEVEDTEKLPELVEALKEAHPTHFKGETPAGEEAPKDVEIIGNKLEKGNSNKTYSFEELSQLTPEEINNNWEIISTSLSQGE